MSRSTDALPRGCRALCGLAVALSTAPVAAQGLLTLDNGAIRIGVDTTMGGAIVLLQRSGSAGIGGNVINSYDLGREVQQSYYSGPADYQPPGTTQHPSWTPWGWNPVQAGDAYGNPSTVVASSTADGVLYTKTIPKQWALENVDSESFLEQWITISGSVATVRNRLTNFRSDTTQYPAYTQELPAVYTRATLTNLKSYTGTQPFTGGAVATLPNTPPPSWGSFRGTEGWAAYVDADDWGLGVVNPGVVSFKGGFFTSGTATLPTSPSTGYFSPLRAEILDHNIVYDYTYHLVLGTVSDIRSFAVANRPDPLPDYQFQGTRAGWFYRGGASDTGFPIADQLTVNLTGSDPQMWGPETSFRAADVPRIYVRAAYDLAGGPSATAELFWERNNGSSPFSATNSTSFTVVNDGQYRIYEINVSATSSWTGQISRLRFDPVTSGAAGSTMDIQFISASVPTTIPINVASGTQTQVEARNAFLTGSYGIVKTGSGTLTLTSSNGFTGDTRIAAGGLRLDHAAALVHSTFDTQSGPTGTLSFGTLTSATFGGLTGANGLTLTNAAATPAGVALTVGGNGGSTEFAGPLSGAGSLTKTGTGTLTLSGGATLEGQFAVNAGRVMIDPGAAGGFAAAGKLLLAPAAGATATLEILSGSNAFSSVGIGAIGDGAGSATIEVRGGATTLAVDAQRLLVGNKGAGTVAVSGGVFTLSGSNDIIIGGDTRFAATNAAGTLTVTGGTLAITGSGALRLGVNVTGTTTGARGTVNLDGGVLETARPFTIGTGSGTVNFNGGVLRPLASSTNFLSVSAARVQAGGAVIDTAGHAVTIAQPLLAAGGGLGGLVKLGAGTLRLAGDSTYGGPTLVAAGTLDVVGNLAAATGVVTVAAGATLAGTGTVGGATTLQAGATLSPGASPGTLSFAQGLIWNGGSHYNWQVFDAAGTAGAAAGWDLVNVAGTLSIAATPADPFRINLWTLSGIAPDVDGQAVGFDPTQAASWRIATASGGIDGFAADRFRIVTEATNGTGGFANDTLRGTFSLALSGTTGLDLVFTPVTTLTWYGDGATPGGSGTWTAGGANWHNGQDVGPWAAVATAVFSGTGGSVTVGQGVEAAAGLQFTGPGYTLAGGTLVLGGTAAAGQTVEVAAGVAATLATPLAGTAGLTKTGAGSLVLSASGSLSGVTTVAAGTLVVDADTALGTTATGVSAGGTLQVNPGVTLTAPSLTLAGGRLEASGATLLVDGTAGLGQFVIVSGTVTGSPGLVVSGDGLVRLPTDRRQVVDLATLEVDHATGGRIDIGTGRINVGINGIGEADLQAALIAGRGTGSFSGTSGIMTTGPKASAGASTALVGYRVLASGAAIVAWAAAGDANLDGVVNSIDTSLINNGGMWGKGNAAGATWSQGDFNYSGGVSSIDITLMNNTGLFGKGSYLPVPATGTLAAVSAGGLDGSFAMVPEPAGWLLAAVGLGCGWTWRRWRRAISCDMKNLKKP